MGCASVYAHHLNLHVRYDRATGGWFKGHKKWIKKCASWAIVYLFS